MPDFDLSTNGPLSGRAPITNPAFLLLCGEVQALTDVIKDLGTLGFTAAGAEAARQVVLKHHAEARVHLAQKAIRLAAQHGADLSRVSVLTGGDSDGLWVSWQHDDGVEAAST